MSIECDGCKQPITFAINPTSGKFIPLQKVTAYEIDWRTLPGEEKGKSVAVKIEREIFISHFLTCTDPNRFSRRPR